MNIKRFLGFGCMLGLFLGSSAKTIDVYVSQQVSGQVWGIERSGFFNGREKWAKDFENQRV